MEQEEKFRKVTISVSGREYARFEADDLVIFNKNLYSFKHKHEQQVEAPCGAAIFGFEFTLPKNIPSTLNFDESKVAGHPKARIAHEM